MQPTSKSSSASSIASAIVQAGPQIAQGGDSKSGDSVGAGKQDLKKSAPVAEPGKPLGAYQVSMGHALARAHAQADAHLQAFIRAEGALLPPIERSLFAEFLDHGEYGLAYDTAITLMDSGCKWDETSLAHLQAAALAMGIQYPRLAHE